MKIAICDDEKPFQKMLSKIINNYMSNKNHNCIIDTYSSGKELLEFNEKLGQYTIIFLDINMEELDGIDTAMKIRSYSRDVYIAFVTAYVKYSLEGYKVNAIRYLLKSNKNFDLTVSECMDAILFDINYEVPKKVFNFRECKKELYIDRIIYIESQLHIVTYHVIENKKKIFTMATTLNEVEQELSDYSFLRIHQSFLVNLKHVKDINSYMAILDDGSKLPIPRAKYKKIKEQFTAYKGEL